MTAPEDYRIIYNWDGAPHGYSEVPQSTEAFVQKAFAPLEACQVGALFWCVGSHTAHWDSDALEILGDVDGRRYTGAMSYVATENIRQMIDRGEDPHAALIERGRALGLPVFASLRMNDNHFGGLAPDDVARSRTTEKTRMRIDHPEWMLGGRAASDWFAASWNMSVPEVRENRLAHLEELCHRWDWDGVELDWQRHAFHLPADDAYRLRYVLTDLQRAARRLADELADRRGRPFHVAARVAPRLETCFKSGYDIPTWIEEELVDILIPAANAGTDPSVQVGEFVELCRDHGTCVYPGLDGGLPEPHVGPEPAAVKAAMRTRAIVDRYHHAGATGIYCFNWHADGDSRRELLSQIGSPASLRRQDRIYAAVHRVLIDTGPWRGAYRPDRVYGEVPVALVRTFTGDGPIIDIEIVDELDDDPPASLELRVRLREWVRGDRVEVRWDHRALANGTVDYCSQGENDRIGVVAATSWHRFSLDPARVTPGRHQVQVALLERHPQLACDIVLTDVELVVRYGTGDGSGE
ncbi:MAG: hypothetical protein CMJ18_02095 [Phycisphaeraceae bacterium]|nr:hypothetical protein [Phycisphaeraceae bacterium]